MKYSEEKIIVRDLTTEGDGISALKNGKTVFVPGLLPEEEAVILPLKENASYVTGSLKRLIVPSRFRTDAKCPIAGECGGCSIEHMSYEGQLVYKRSRVVSCFERIGGFTGLEIDKCVASPETFFYRNKLAFPVGCSNGKIVMGCYKKRTHEIIKTDACYLHSGKMMDCANSLFKFTVDNKIKAYDEKTCKGTVRHIIVRESSDGKILAGFVVNGVVNGNVNGEDFPIEKAKKQLSAVADSIVINYNDTHSNLIIGGKTDIISGSGTITETILGKHFNVSLNTFLQVNIKQAENLYKIALDYADIKPTDTVADLYCGIGTITLCAAPFAKKIYGIEIVPQSIENARDNGKINNIQNAEFLCADAGEGFTRVLKDAEKIDCIIVDPPRKGLSNEALKAIISANASRIVYVSCDPATLARDARILCDAGYEIKKVTPVDMFPMTTHVETVVLMSKVK